MKLTAVEASKLYEILDENIGVFKPKKNENNSLKAREFYLSQKSLFMETFTTNIPEKYWFQGGYHQSVTLLCDSTGLHLDLSLCAHKNTEEVCKKS